MPPRKPRPEATTREAVVGWFRQWLALREEKNHLATREKELHHRMCGAIEEVGVRDDKGSLYLDLPEVIEGFAQLKYQRAVSKALNEDRAEKLVKDKGLWDRCTAVTVRLTDQQAALQLLQERGLLVPGQIVEAEIDQEEILKAHYEDLISQEELDSLFDVSESYSFRQVKG